MVINERRMVELKEEKEELLSRYKEYTQVMKNIEVRINQIDGILIEEQRLSQQDSEIAEEPAAVE